MMYDNAPRMKDIKEFNGKSIACDENSPSIRGMPDESMRFDYINKIMNIEYLIQFMEDIVNELKSDSQYLTPDIVTMLAGCSTKLEALTSSIVEGDGSDDTPDGDAEVMKLKMVNPSVHVEDYNGPLHVLKSLWKEEKQFSINLRFDCSSYGDLQNFIDYFSDLTEKTDTANYPFTTSKYVTNLNVEFSKAAIVKRE